MLTAPSCSKAKTEVFSQDQQRLFRLSALLYVAHVQPVCEAASAIALLRQHDPEHARKEHARHKRCHLATHGWLSFSVMANQPSLFSIPFSSKARPGAGADGPPNAGFGRKVDMPQTRCSGLVLTSGCRLSATLCAGPLKGARNVQGAKAFRLKKWI
jgi:hypothetical protein